MKKNKNGKFGVFEDPSSIPILGQPENVTDMINKYGTYEIQPTLDSDNDYPKIDQGLPKTENRRKLDTD